MRGPTRERSHSSAQIVTRVAQHTHHGTRPTWERSLFCLKYDKIFSITGHLKEHERTHMAEKSFKCTNCDKSFSTYSTRDQTHTGEKPFLLKVWQGLLNNWPLEGTWKDPHGREAIQVHKGWQDILNILIDKKYCIYFMYSLVPKRIPDAISDPIITQHCMRNLLHNKFTS